ncbi:MAG: class I SAM-dependent RNA methyltransferase [Sphingomonadaceae bacterium]
MSAPGDWLDDLGALQHGPHHIAPECQHFGRCGGCQLQHCDDEVLRQFVEDRVRMAASGQGIGLPDPAPVHLSPPYSRRRASLYGQNGGGGPVIGYREHRAHRVVNLRECPVLSRQLFESIKPLRQYLAQRRGRYGVQIELTLTDQGVDCALQNLTVEGLEQTESLLDLARDNSFARISVDQGYGAETMWEPAPVTVTFSGVAVAFPASSFLQATLDGEECLRNAVTRWTQGCNTIADLFSGLGTFSFALAGQAKVLAAEASRSAHLACKSAAQSSQLPVFALHRDLYRNPLMPDELNRFDAIVLDPPRAGAKEQIRCLAESHVPKIVYVSCNPSSWSRDARTLGDAGWRLVELQPVGQFRWSTHVELASMFVRE